MADNVYNQKERVEEEEGSRYTGGDYEVDTRDSESYDARQRSTYFRRGEALVRRPKEDILEDINHRLIYDDTITADKIQVGVNDGGEVTLQGTVKSYVAWRTLQGVIQEIPGVTKIRNRLRIQPNG
jgi:osmotically-inducible protein OsmY